MSVLARELLEPVGLLLLRGCVFLLLCPDSPHWLVVKVVLDLLPLVSPSTMVPASSPSLPCPGNWPGTWPALKRNSSSGDTRLPYTALAELPTSPWCYPGAERVARLSPLNLVSSKACCSELFSFTNCQPVPSLTAEGAPWDGSADQGAALWTLQLHSKPLRGCPGMMGSLMDKGNHQSPWVGESQTKVNPLLARVCLQTASYQQKKLSKLLFFPAKRIPPFFFFLL